VFAGPGRGTVRSAYRTTRRATGRGPRRGDVEALQLRGRADGCLDRGAGARCCPWGERPLRGSPHCSPSRERSRSGWCIKRPIKRMPGGSGREVRWEGFEEKSVVFSHRRSSGHASSRMLVRADDC
jgi:hypothetical protein